jgi:FKBP-type peptidyl-prolyl cis-trans isomerase FkpA
MLTRAVVPALLAFLILTGCTTEPAAPSNYAAYSQSDLQPGTGATAVSGSAVTVDYTGWLYDAAAPNFKGPQFDSSIGRGPFSFTIGAGQVIRGWEQGVVGMRVGGVRRLIVPPSLGYGGTRTGPIPPYATLVFDITLESVTGP